MDVLYVALIDSLVVIAAVMIHYEFLGGVSWLLPKIRGNHRLRILAGVYGALLAHLAEVATFASAFYLMDRRYGWGKIEGEHEFEFDDYLYFSLTNFTTLGYGDIHPVGYLRFLAGLESLTGLVLITWTASFLFVEMQRNWEDDGDDDQV